ncbi:hypothetical protein [Kribbella sp. CA-293567]|uniref:hypothetical protein n=1 Tax=Kribbella sp. CA-293567 TaxID=3002436 RepID=UPI0022DD352F|nr:hypothetical protein [Kribbella sp. CA-293567]WBQ03818.1 hypothetical protein OX958_28090 [Kribbella sp. CA-293567]
MTLDHRTGWDEALEAAAAHVRAACRHRTWADSSFCNACDDVADTIEETPYKAPVLVLELPVSRWVAGVLPGAAAQPRPVVALGKRSS